VAFIRETHFITDNPGLDMGDLHELVAMILQLDAEAIGASIPALEAAGITASKRHTIVPADDDRAAVPVGAARIAAR
jgi:hypothetical protein